MRRYYPYTEWEDYIAGMWRIVPKYEEPVWLQVAFQFTADADLYGAWMLRAVAAWPIASEHNLANEGMNRWAWIGHAACCLATGCPEYLTRQAWGMLTDEQRDEANWRAEIALLMWIFGHASIPRGRGAAESARGLSVKAKILSWISKWEKRGYPAGIPDEAPANLEEMNKVPSYRMICLALMKNDVALETLGFTREPCEAYNLIKRQEIALRKVLTHY